MFMQEDFFMDTLKVQMRLPCGASRLWLIRCIQTLIVGPLFLKAEKEDIY